MNRTKYDQIRDEIAADDHLQQYLYCSVCKILTPIQDLNIYGARCLPCYRDYCNEGNPQRTEPLTGHDRKRMADAVRQALSGANRPGPTAYMAEMRRREAAGEPITPAQKAFLAAARGGSFGEPS